LRLVLVKKPLVFVGYQRQFFVAYLTVFRSKHRHLIRVNWLVSVVDYWLIWLLVVFTTIVAIYLIALNVDKAWALTHLAVF